MDISGIAAVVTGGGSGLGAATARSLAGKGAKVTVTGSSGAWRSVTAGTKKGWVHSKYLKAVPAKVVKTTTTSLNLRASASTKAKIVTVLKKGTKVTVTASSGKWRKVTVGTKKGWVHSDYLK